MGLGLGGVVAAIAAGVIAVPLLVAAVFVILVVANRADPDPTGRRPTVVYAATVSFVTLYATLFATVLIVSSLASLIDGHRTVSPSDVGASSPFPFSLAVRASGPQHPVGDAAARGVVLGLLLAIVAGLAYLVHLRAAQRATAGLDPAQPAARVRSSYLAAICFVSTALAVIASVAATYQLFRIIAPGVFNAAGSGSRLGAFRTMLPLLYLALASVGLLVLHVRQLPPDARPTLAWLRPPAPPPPAGEPAPVTATIAAEKVETLETPPPRPRKRAPRRPPSP